MNTAIRHNPFSTCFTRPGRVPFLLSDSQGQVKPKTELTSLIDRFLSERCVGQIVGPHGCGKTTLCHTIADELHDIFPVVDYVAIRSGRDLETVRYGNLLTKGDKGDKGDRESSMVAGPKLTIVDGAERLSLLQQRMIVANLAPGKGVGSKGVGSKGVGSKGVGSKGVGSKGVGSKGVGSKSSPLGGLLFTSHRPLKFVSILHTITPCLVTFIGVARHLDPSLQLEEHQLSDLFEQAGHNIREAIMLLYDWHESSRANVVG